MVYTFTATEDVTQGAVVKLTGDTSVGVATAGTDLVIGVAIESATAGENVPVQIPDVYHFYAGADITAGAFLMPTVEGDVIPAVTTGDKYYFLAITDALTGEEIRAIPYVGTVA